MALTGLCLSGCGKALTESECEELLNHYTELLVKEQNPAALAQEVANRQDRARDLAKLDPKYEFDRCPSAVSRRQFDCAIRAVSVDEVERCLVL